MHQHNGLAAAYVYLFQAVTPVADGPGKDGGATIGLMKMRKKYDLPSKVCAHCGLPFTWRKKWERDWEQVKYCSERCRRAGKPDAAPGNLPR